jgi:hypothetical protein
MKFDAIIWFDCGTPKRSWPLRASSASMVGASARLEFDDNRPGGRNASVAFDQGSKSAYVNARALVKADNDGEGYGDESLAAD